MTKKLKDLRTEKNSNIYVWLKFLAFNKLKEIKTLDIDTIIRLLCDILHNPFAVEYWLHDGSERLNISNQVGSLDSYIFKPKVETFSLKDGLIERLFYFTREYKLYDLCMEDLNEKWYGYSTSEEDYKLNGTITIKQAIERWFDKKLKPLSDIDYYLESDLEYKKVQDTQIAKIKELLLIKL